MKRAIKFRGKSLYDKYPKANGGFEIPQGAFVYGNLVIDMNGNPQIDIQGYIDGNSFHHSLWVDADTVGQFTGLLDRNGKEIYEGDIVLWTRKKVHIEGRPLQDFSDVCKIYYDEKKCAFYFRYEMDCGACCGILDFNDDRAEISYIEVIGNIYDNPEFLKGGKYGD